MDIQEQQQMSLMEITRSLARIEQKLDKILTSTYQNHAPISFPRVMDVPLEALEGKPMLTPEEWKKKKEKMVSVTPEQMAEKLKEWMENHQQPQY